MGKLQISVEVSSVIRASPNSFRVAWIQRSYENAHLSATERWTAILTIVLDPPHDALPERLLSALLLTMAMRHGEIACLLSTTWRAAPG